MHFAGISVLLPNLKMHCTVCVQQLVAKRLRGISEMLLGYLL